jgi:cardiolipin synthase
LRTDWSEDSILSASVVASTPPIADEPKESRRWLKPRIQGELLYRLAPPRPKRKRLGAVDLPDRLRSLVRAWWMWLVAAFAFLENDLWYFALPSATLALIFYHTSPRFHPAIYALDPDLDPQSAEFRSTIAGMTGTRFIDGNRVAIYNNGDEFYPAMLEAIEAAQHSVTMEQYIFWNGQVGRRFAEAFAEKAREGIPVKLLVDAIGSATLGEDILAILRAGGCQLAWFRPIHWFTLDRANQRTHRKSLIIDGCVAFTGGAGIADHWLGSARDEHEWRDIQIRVEGPAVFEQQSGFAQNWLLATGEILSSHDYFPLPQSAGEAQVQTILSSPSTGACAAGTMYMIAVQCARDYIYIANPYFIPAGRVIEMLAGACSRGVKVKLMLAGRHNDTWWARQNSLRLYGKLLRAGVEIFEYQPSMLHQKTMVVDGAWGTVGTANFDNRSFALSEETNVCVYEKSVVQELCDIFAADLAKCRRIELSDWNRRGLAQNAKEQLASLIEDQV